ncbi:MAG: hypothetical protein ACRDHW_22125 [Ktedonobacteraceae bacterium]
MDFIDVLQLTWIWFWQGGGWQPTLAISVCMAVFAFLFARAFLAAYNLGRRSVQVAAAAEITDQRPLYLREIEYVAASAWEGRSEWNEKGD